MKLSACPHCGNDRIVKSKVPKDMVVVMHCPSCKELVILFRGRLVGVKRAILESGSRDERVAHLAEVIDQFIDETSLFSPDEGETESAEAVEAGQIEPISDEEVHRFVRFDLKRLDDPSYFRKYFG